MVKIYRKLHRSMDTLSFFTCNSWTWANNNLELLRHQLTPDDLKVRLVKRRAFRMQVVEPPAARRLRVLLSVDRLGMREAFRTVTSCQCSR